MNRAVVFTPGEQRYLFSEIMTLFQNGYYRYYNGPLQQAILVKLGYYQAPILTVDFTEEEVRYIQSILENRKDFYLARLGDPRLQHILQGQNTQGFGTGDSGGPPKENKIGGQGVGGSAGSYHYFQSTKQFNLCKVIINKLK
jgi:hypothetical protein